MNKQLTCLVGLMVLLMLASRSDALITSEGLNGIDYFLTPKVPRKKRPDFETNLRTILGWLPEIRRETIPDLPQYELMVESLNDIEELSNRIERRQCDPRSYQLRKELNAAQYQRGRANGLSEEISRHLSFNLARSCQKEHIRTYLNCMMINRNGEGVTALLRMRPFFLRTICGNIIGTDNYRIDHATYLDWAKIYFENLADVLQFPVSDGACRVAYEMATDAAKKRRKDPELREIFEGVRKKDPVLNADQAINVFKRTILEDCKIYMEDFGKLIFTNAQEDLDEYVKGDEILVRSPEFAASDLADYYLAWAIHKTCSEYLSNPEVMHNFSSEMVKFLAN